MEGLWIARKKTRISSLSCLDRSIDLVTLVIKRQGPKTFEVSIFLARLTLLDRRITRESVSKKIDKKEWVRFQRLGGQDVWEALVRGMRQRGMALSYWKDRLLRYGWMENERLLFTTRSAFLSLVQSNFSIFYVVAKKRYCSARRVACTNITRRIFHQHLLTKVLISVEEPLRNVFLVFLRRFLWKDSPRQCQFEKRKIECRV